MTVSHEKFVASTKASAEASLNTASAFATTLFTAAERVSSLNLAVARSSFDDTIAFSKALMAAKDPKELIALQMGALTPSVEKGVAYSRSLAEIGGETKEELSKLVEGETSALTGNVNAALEGLFKNAPAGSESVVAAVKTAMANATSAYEGAAKAAKKVAEATQASVAKATEAAVESVSKGAKAAAGAIKVA
jgi:phasin family protein